MTPKQRLNILLADDGSQHAQAAVEWLQSISLPPQSQILVVHVFHSGQIDFVPDLERSLERTKKQLSDRGYCVETELQLGHAAEKILEIAAARTPDLIVLGAKGLRSTVSILLGGVAQHVVEYACCPVLIVRAPFHGFCKVLFVTDGSMASQSAACYLANFPLADDAHISLMHILPPMQTPVMMEPYFGGAWQTVYAVPRAPQEEEAARERETKLGEALLTRTRRLLQQYGLEATAVLARGDAATEILDYARENQTDLIVAGSRGLSQFKSLWMGSVSRKLVHYSNCSVMIVKAPEKE